LNLGEAARQLAEVIYEVERREADLLPIDDLAIPFQESSLSLAQAVDRRVWVLKSLKSQIANAKACAVWWSNKAKYLERAIEHLEEGLLGAFQETVLDELQGEVSRVKLCSNGGKRSVQMRYELGSVKRVIVTDLDKFSTQFVKQETIHVLLDTFEDAVRDGSIVTNAATPLVRGKHLRY